MNPYRPISGVSLLVATLAAGMLAACTTPPAPAEAQADVKNASATAMVTGVASYRERIALPPGAVFEATLEDVSLTDAPSTVVAKVVVNQTMPPIRFSIAYDPADIDPGRRYAVRARILLDGALRFTSDRIHPVLTGGAGSTVEIPMRAVGGAASQPAPGGEAAAAVMPAHGLRLPASFRGDLPCADCEGVRHQLDLWPDQVFHLRREWLGKEFVRGDMGRWRIDPSRRALILQGSSEAPVQFEIRGANRLRLLDVVGKPIVSDLPYELESDGTLDPAEVPSIMAGEMTYMADSPRFTECLTGRSYPIFPGEEALKLQRAYLATIREPGAKLYVSFEGTLTQRPGMEGDQLVPTMTVERYINVWPGQACERARADASLVNTYWRIVRMQDQAITPVPGRREPHLLLRQSGEGTSYAATVGCNQMVGPFQASGDSLSFSRAATTLMACPPPLEELERQLGAVLEGTRSARVQGNTLALRDEAGKDLALLEAVYF